MVERQLPKLDVEGSTPFTRSKFCIPNRLSALALTAATGLRGQCIAPPRSCPGRWSPTIGIGLLSRFARQAFDRSHRLALLAFHGFPQLANLLLREVTHWFIEGNARPMLHVAAIRFESRLFLRRGRLVSQGPSLDGVSHGKLLIFLPSQQALHGPAPGFRIGKNGERPVVTDRALAPGERALRANVSGVVVAPRAFASTVDGAVAQDVAVRDGQAFPVGFGSRVWHVTVRLVVLISLVYADDLEIISQFRVLF